MHVPRVSMSGRFKCCLIFKISPIASLFRLCHCFNQAVRRISLTRIYSGSNLTISATGNVTQTITKGAHALISVKLQLNYGGQIPILQRDEDLCALLERDDEIKQKCPIDKDKDIKIEKSVQIPERVPKGKFVVLIDALTEKQEKITCLTTEIRF